MTSFDPSKPINDPSVWYPKGLFLDNKTKKITAFSAEQDDDKTFLLDDENMVALSRFLWTGKLLPTDRETYIRVLGLTDTNEMSDKVWKEVDNLLGTYTEVSSSCTTFQEVTWNGLVDLSGTIKTYATLAGGTSDSSYYRGMLEWIGQYNDEMEKASPDQKTLDDLESSIKGAINGEEKKISSIQDKIAETLSALKQFHDDCKAYESTLEGDEKSLQSLLEEEGNDIEHLTAVIAEERKNIQDLQVAIDRDHDKIKDTAYYVWIPFIGTIAGVTVDILAESDIKRLEASMKKIQETIDANVEKLQIAVRLQGDIQSMGAQVTDIINVIGPAVETLELLQGAWALMAADLTTVYDLFESDKQEIPPMLLVDRELKTIVDAWNELKTHADEYIAHAFMTTDPEKVTIQDYLNQLDARLK
ncbi:hypothetical protein CBS147332_1553 [Penicillium roqueforti]|nr:hypothetical protein CBS147332_1553 [Penicillium roqueforti]KAI3123114.1 hypothetical protein CBS147331_1564 [Penicillium roqueforti]